MDRLASEIEVVLAENVKLEPTYAKLPAWQGIPALAIDVCEQFLKNPRRLDPAQVVALYHQTAAAGTWRLAVYGADPFALLRAHRLQLWGQLSERIGGPELRTPKSKSTNSAWVQHHYALRGQGLIEAMRANPPEDPNDPGARAVLAWAVYCLRRGRGQWCPPPRLPLP